MTTAPTTMERRRRRRRRSRRRRTKMDPLQPTESSMTKTATEPAAEETKRRMTTTKTATEPARLRIARPANPTNPRLTPPPPPTTTTTAATGAAAVTLRRRRGRARGSEYRSETAEIATRASPTANRLPPIGPDGDDASAAAWLAGETTARDDFAPARHAADHHRGARGGIYRPIRARTLVDSELTREQFE